jgi:hypothetical protein
MNDYPCPIPTPRHGHSLLLRPSEKVLYLFGGQQVQRHQLRKSVHPNHVRLCVVCLLPLRVTANF